MDDVLCGINARSFRNMLSLITPHVFKESVLAHTVPGSVFKRSTLITMCSSTTTMAINNEQRCVK